jgi:hypothetical protein
MALTLWQQRTSLTKTIQCAFRRISQWHLIPSLIFWPTCEQFEKKEQREFASIRSGLTIQLHFNPHTHTFSLSRSLFRSLYWLHLKHSLKCCFGNQRKRKTNETKLCQNKSLNFICRCFFFECGFLLLNAHSNPTAYKNNNNHGDNDNDNDNDHNDNNSQHFLFTFNFNTQLKIL